MNLLKIAARMADQMTLRTKVITLSTNFTEADKLSDRDFETEIEREGLPIVSPSLQALIDPNDQETFGGIPSYHIINIGNIQFDRESADPSVGIMSDAISIIGFDIIGIDGYAVNSEDAEILKNEIDLTDEEEQQLSQSQQYDDEPDYEF